MFSPTQALTEWVVLTVLATACILGITRGAARMANPGLTPAARAVGALGVAASLVVTLALAVLAARALPP
jgi:hypothetical protein